jgi:hypothetical protein
MSLSPVVEKMAIVAIEASPGMATRRTDNAGGEMINRQKYRELG